MSAKRPTAEELAEYRARIGSRALLASGADLMVERLFAEIDALAAIAASAKRASAALDGCSLTAGFFAEMGVSDASDAAIKEAVEAFVVLDAFLAEATTAGR